MYQQPHQLEGGSYFASPSPPQTHHRQPRRRFFCCLLSTFVKLVVAASFALALLVLVLWLIFRPARIIVEVQSASLTRFDLTTNTTTNSTMLSFDLVAKVTLHNPNRRIGIYYDQLEASALYEEVRFSWVPLPEFYQGHENTTAVEPVFRVSSAFAEGFSTSRTGGVFRVDVWISGKARYRLGALVTRKHVARVKCELGLKVAVGGNNGSENSGFSSTGCDVVDW